MNPDTYRIQVTDSEVNVLGLEGIQCAISRMESPRRWYAYFPSHHDLVRAWKTIERSIPDNGRTARPYRGLLRKIAIVCLGTREI